LLPPSLRRAPYLPTCLVAQPHAPTTAPCAQLAPKQRQLEEQRQRNTGLAEQLSKLKEQLAEAHKARQAAQEDGRQQVQVRVCLAVARW
jgi:hypothetical protein